MHGSELFLFLHSVYAWQVVADDGSLEASVFRQIVWHLVWRLEGKFAAAVQVQSPPQFRRLVPRPSDAEKQLAVATKVWNPKNSRRTEQELNRYLLASRRAFQDSQFLAVCGPDGTKVGTDLNISEPLETS